MEEMVKVTIDQNNQQVVNARELYDRLGLNLSHWKRWAKKNIENNQFAIENEDWVGFAIEVSGNETKDYAISIPFAKKIAMMARTDKGNEIRDYFIECESIAKNLAVPKTYAAALLEAGRLALELETTQAKLIEAQPKVDFYDAVTDSMGSIDLGTAAKVLNMGFGRTTMFDKLRKLEVLMASNTPYQKYIDLGWFRVIETKWQDKNGDTHIYFKTMIFQKGLDGVRKLLQNE